ncbi:Uncharacterised protein [Mycobacterium tuberculosis]|nr:Uncharacterised protein [Mycobacterium tuberculosis]
MPTARVRRSHSAPASIAGQLLDSGHIDLHAHGVGLDGAEQLTGQPGNVAEQAVMCGLTGGQERQNLAARLLESGGKRFDGAGQYCGHPLGPQR